MGAAATIVLAFSMSMDAFAAALVKGAVLRRSRLWEALRTGAIYGIVEAATPLLSWAAGAAAAVLDHPRRSLDRLCPVELHRRTHAAESDLGPWRRTRLAASLTRRAAAGRCIGPAFGRFAEALGGVCLIGIGTKILVEYTFAA